VKLNEQSIEWAIKSLDKYADTDLFPKPVELKVICSDIGESVSRISDLDISDHQPVAPRRFIVPKDNYSCRAATQLDPLDSLILTAIVHQFGELVEKRRLPVSEETVFSYRLQPSSDGRLYGSDNAWNRFWRCCCKKCIKREYAAIVDISDFYNQISHHTIENQLNESGVPNQIKRWVLRLLKTESARVSRGIPVGPHGTHILAEASLIPLDNSLVSQGIEFCRFVDDIVLFADDDVMARTYVYQIAEILDKQQQRLQLQKAKTKIMNMNQFQHYCNRMIEDQPINASERELLDIINKYSEGDPYRTILISEIDPDDFKKFTTEIIEEILSGYINRDEPDFVRLRWFLRRLSQVGHPGAVEFCLNNFCKMVPAASEVCQYFVSAGSMCVDYDWPKIGAVLLDLFDNSIIQASEYFQISLLSLFSRNVHLDQVPAVLPRYKNSSPFLRREIIILAAESGHIDWLRELKQDVTCMDPWTKRAFLYASKKLPEEERKFFLRSISPNSLLESLIIEWAKKN